MELSQPSSLLPLVATGYYTILLVISYVRRGPQARLTSWLLAFLGTSIIWELLLIIIPNSGSRPGLTVKLLVLSTAVLGMTTTVFAKWSWRKRALIPVGIIVLAALILDLLFPMSGFTLPTAASTRIRYSSLFSHLSWFGMALYILLRVWRDYRHTTLPWHANRLLFWGLTLLLIFSGEGLIFTHWSGLTITGHLIRFVGVAGLIYAISSHRIFDVRTRAQNVIGLFFITFLSGAPIVISVLLVQWLARNEPLETTILLMAITVTISMFLYPPLHRFAQRISNRFILGETADTSQVVRNYSQAIYRTLDVNQLSLVVIGTLSELLETNLGALMLVSNTNQRLSIKPIPTMGSIPQRILLPPHNSPFIGALLDQHQPLLQYEIDFNPDFKSLSPEERWWLSEMAMEVYIPITTGTELDGLIGLGPKNTGLPYQPRELELAQIMADQTVVALQNSRLYGELTAQNETVRRLNVDLVQKNERLRIMDRVKSDFIAIASHELRTPLTQVIGYADILGDMNEDGSLSREQTNSLLGHINRATKHLESLIAAMLDASEIDTAGMKLRLAPTPLESVILVALEPLAEAMRERRITLTTNGMSGLPAVQADQMRLVQAFTNLIGNAVKYTPDHGQISISAGVSPAENGAGEYVELVISDTGIGIDPEFHELIFEKFFRIGDPQLHSTGSTKFKGAGPGLGLPIAKGVIQAHGGEIWVESDQEDEDRMPGSRFYVILPVNPPATSPKPAGA